MSVTKEFSDLLLKRSHYLYSFENGAVKGMLAPMQQALIQSRERLNDLVRYSTGYTLDWRIARLSDRIKEMEGILQAASYDSAGILQNKLYEVANSESNFVGNMLADKFASVGVDIIQLPFAHIDYVVNNPLLAVDLQSKLSKASTSSLNSIKSQLTQSIVQGEDIAKATARLIGPVGAAFLDPGYAVKGVRGSLSSMISNRAEQIARSEILYVSNQVSREIYKQNRDVLKGVVYISALDRRTCLECGTLNGQEYNYKEGSEDHGGPILPLHVSCRCFYAPVTYSWAELEKMDKVEKGVSKQTKGAFIDVVPKALNYEQWLKTLEPQEVKSILGSSRYKLWDSGELKLTQMVKNNRILTIDELDNIVLKLPEKAPLYARVDALSNSQLQKMSDRQAKAWADYASDSKKTRAAGEAVEEETAYKISADHIVGRKPFDMFIDDNFIEHKVLFEGTGEIRVKKDQIASKLGYAKRFKVKPGTIITDRRDSSPTFGNYYYRKGVGNFKIEYGMQLARDFDHLQSMVLRGKQEIQLTQAIAKVPVSKNIKMAEEWAKQKFSIKYVDYGSASPEVGDLINKYIGGSIERLGVKPKGLFYDASQFVGKANENVWAKAFENGNIYFNPAKFTSVDQVKNDLEFIFKSGKFSTVSEGHVIRHEVAHLKYFDIGGTEKTAAQKLTKTMQSDITNGIGEYNIPRYVSSYAEKSQGEFYAEMTTKLLNGEKLHPVCTKIMKDIERGLKANKKIIENTKPLMAKAKVERLVVKTPEEASNLMRKLYGSGKNKEVTDAILSYTNREFALWNPALKENSKLSFENIITKLAKNKKDFPAETIKEMTTFQKLLETAPSYQGTVYRGEKLFDMEDVAEFIKGYKKGSIVVTDSFLSTSVKESLIKDRFMHTTNTNILFEIKSKKGVYLGPLADQPIEREVAFKYKSKFKVVEIEEMTGRYKGMKIYLEEI